ncbi:MAG: hypothetical protein A3H33_02835 [Betaproteobacteria bacterium RIFCSPLOWO2_02_FULL_65_20]|nr:MAG: hypothetical protein A3H33_02835 [Betaproteobacteria bacterium RIFCSPLOWO2_02_FULL_65_20]
MNANPLPPPSTETLAIVRRLIGFDTVSRNSNLGLIEWVRDYLAGLGVRSRLTYDAAGGKANLFDMRYLPGTDPAEFIERIERYAQTALVPEMHQVSGDAGIVLELLAEAPDLNTPDGDRIACLGMLLAGTSVPGRVGFATDGGHFHRAGVPTIVVGPGSIDQAHKPNEYIELAQVARCELFLTRLRDKLTAR